MIVECWLANIDGLILDRVVLTQVTDVLLFSTLFSKAHVPPNEQYELTDYKITVWLPERPTEMEARTWAFRAA
jgi:hypothetical protein